MQVFHCDRCGTVVPFTAQRCGNCGALVGYLTERRTLRVLRQSENAAVYTVDGHGEPLWRCLNAAWGCNWMLPADTEGVWCRSCRLTRGRPDEGRPDAMTAWMTAEATKRRLVHQLDALALPVHPRSASTPDGLAFDLVYLPGEGGLTGHLDGVVTLDLAETDEQHRDHLRRQLDESFRTLIGHLRHEIGHHYWSRLVGLGDDIATFRQVFGDERADYGSAIAEYYAGDSGWDTSRYVTAYAASHPLEDWAETFAHYLHILDAADTAAAHHLVRSGPAATSGRVLDRAATLDLAEILDIWRPISAAVNDISASLGGPPVYPFDPVGAVVDKLDFVHRCVNTHADRDRSFAEQ